MNNTGLCECGCGGMAPIAKRTRVDRGWVKGYPKRFIANHSKYRHGADQPCWRGGPKPKEVYIKPTLQERFDAYVVPEPMTGCWLWAGPNDSYGYGQLGVNGRLVLAHRLSWFLAYGVMPPKLVCVLHRCDNPAFVNPKHLFLGSQKENIYDMCKKRRQWIPAGGQNPKAKLTDVEVLAIRVDTRKSGQIARAYGITTSTVREIKTLRTWRHI